VQVVRLEEPSLLWIIEDPVDEKLLVDLAVVDLLLDGPRRHQPVNCDLPFLANPPSPLTRLHVCAGVPVWIEDDDPVSSGQIHAQAANPGSENEEEDVVVVVEPVDEGLPGPDRGSPVQPQVGVVLGLGIGLQDPQHLPGLGEQQDPVSLLPPNPE